MIRTQKQKFMSFGFTLIEVLITVVIMIIVTGGAIASFINFNDRQNVQVTAQSLQAMLRSAQVKAKTGSGASECHSDLSCDANGECKLRGYKVRNIGTTTVVIERVCAKNSSDGVVDSITTSQIEEMSVVTGVTVSNLQFEFLALSAGVRIGNGSLSQADITIYSTHGYSYTFTVNSMGEINQGEFN